MLHRWMHRPRRKSANLIIYSIYLFCLNVSLADDIGDCRKACLSGGIAYPLPKAEVNWPAKHFSQCEDARANCTRKEICCNVEHCRHGCALYSRESPSLRECHDEYVDHPLDPQTAACFQGTWRMHQMYLASIKGMLTTSMMLVISPLPATRKIIVTYQITSNAADRSSLSLQKISFVAQRRRVNAGRVLPWTSLRLLTLAAGRADVIEEHIDDAHVMEGVLYEYRCTAVVVHGEHISSPPKEVRSPMLTAYLPLEVNESRQLSSPSSNRANGVFVLCWRATHGRSISQRFSYEVTVRQGGKLLESQGRNTTSQCASINKLAADIEYTATVSYAKNGEGRAEHKFTLSGRADGESRNDKALLFANERSVFRIADAFDYVVADDPKTEYTLPSNEDTITAIAYDALKSVLYVGTTAGHIVDGRFGEAIYRTVGGKGPAIRQMIIDARGQRLFVLTADSVVFECPASASCAAQRRIYDFRPSPHYSRMAVDLVNGFMYYVTTTDGHIQEHKLPDSSSSPGKLLIYPKPISNNALVNATSLLVDYDSMGLLVTTGHGEVAKVDLISREVSNTQKTFYNSKSGSYVGVDAIVTLHGRLIVTRTEKACAIDRSNSICMFVEEWVKSKLYVHNYLLPKTKYGRIIAMATMDDHVLPELGEPPGKLQALVNRGTLKISWQPPIALPFQADTNYAVATHYVKGHGVGKGALQFAEFVVDAHSFTKFGLPPGEGIDVTVALCDRTEKSDSCSAAAHMQVTIDGRSADASPKLYVRRLGQVSELSLLGDESPSDVRVPLDGSVDFMSESWGDRLYTLDGFQMISKPMSDSDSSLISSQPMHGDRLTVHSSSATLHVAEEYGLTSYRLTGTKMNSNHRFAPCKLVGGDGSLASANCEQLIALTVDQKSHTIYYWLLSDDGASVDVFSLPVDLRETQRKVGTLAFVPEPISHLYHVDESWIYMTEGGRVALLRSLDQAEPAYLTSKGENVDELLLNEPPPEQTRHLSWPYPIALVDSELQWGTSPTQSFPLFDLTVRTSANNAVLMRTQTLRSQTVLTDELIAKLGESITSGGQELIVEITALSAWDRSNKLNIIQTPALPPTSVTNLTMRVEHVLRPFDSVDNPTPIAVLTWKPPRAWNGDAFGYQVYCYKRTADGRVVYKHTKDVLRVDENTRDARQMITIDPYDQLRSPSDDSLKLTEELDCEVQAMSKQVNQQKAMVGAKRAVRQIALNASLPFYRLLIATVDLLSRQATFDKASLYSVYPSESTPTTKGNPILTSIDPSSVANVYPYVIASDAKGNFDGRQARLTILDRNGEKTRVTIDSGRVTHLAADWNGQSVFMMAWNYRDYKSNSLRNVYLVRMPIDAARRTSLTADTTLWSMEVPRGRWPKEGGAMAVDQFNSFVYYVDDNNNMQIIALRDGKPEFVDVPDCLSNRLEATTVALQYKTASRASPALLLIRQGGKELIKYDVKTQKCTVLKKQLTFHSESVVALSGGVDDTMFVLTSGGLLLTYDVRHQRITHTTKLADGLRPSNGGRLSFTLANAVGQNYADLSCLSLPTRAHISTATPFTRRKQALHVDPPTRPNKCVHIVQPIVQYKTRLTDTQDKPVGAIISGYEMPIVVGGEGETDEYERYSASVYWSNAYTDPSSPPSFSPPIDFRTADGFPSRATSLHVVPLTSTHVLATWHGPEHLEGRNADTITYSTHLWSANAMQPLSTMPTGSLAKSSVLYCKPKCHTIVEASQQYIGGKDNKYRLSIATVPLAKSRDPSSALGPPSAYDIAVYPSIISTRPPLGKIALLGTPSTHSRMSVTWKMQGSQWPHMDVKEGHIEWRRRATEGAWESGKAVALDLDSNNTPKSTPKRFEITGLTADQEYDVRVVGDLLLRPSKEIEVGPEGLRLSAPISNVLTVRTMKGPPGPPRDVILHLNADDPYLTWQRPANSGGLPIIGYNVQYRDDPSDEWTTVMDRGNRNLTFRVEDCGTQCELRLARHETKTRNVDLKRSRDLRVTAFNSAGLGTYQRTTGRGAWPTGGSNVVGVLIGIVLAGLLLCVVCIVFMLCRRNRKTGKKKRHRVGANDFPMGQPPVVLHVTGDYKEADDAIKMIPTSAITSLPHTQRQWVTVNRMLGKGAFGEVYEGLACNLPTSGAKSVRVAIKTLRSGCSNEERVKFLKEAILMSGFKHKNVVRLLGVCLETEPHWLILELMEGGDLLTHLRDCRPSNVMPSQLSLKDLLRIIVDVAKGCAYLEGEHHVHRDLAARNCLVSSRTDTKNGVVKIADFGLARDVYEVDYYRMDGKGLLPIRSMPPESLVDGVFSAKSDVWSFGVLMWEVMTLGQQPYHAMSNWDVINFVRGGGRLRAPDHCPAEIFHTMNSCWATRKDDRPTMAIVLKQIELLAKIPKLNNDAPFPPTPFMRYTSPPGVANAAFASDTDKSNRSSAASTARVSDGSMFATTASAGFDRGLGSAQSMRDNNGEHFRQSKRGKFFKSLRKETKKVRPPMAPSKEQLNESEEARRASLHRTSWERDGNHRPISSADESFTTNRAEYDANLIKNNGHAVAQYNNVDRPLSVGSPASLHPAHVNRAFSPSNETMSSAYYEMPRSTVGTASTRLSAATPDALRMVDVEGDPYMRPDSASPTSPHNRGLRESLPPPPPAPDSGYRPTIIPIDPTSSKYSSKPSQV